MHALIVGLYLAFLAGLVAVQKRRALKRRQRFDAMIRPSAAWDSNRTIA